MALSAGTAMVIVYYHLVRAFGANIYTEPQAGGRAYEGGTMLATGNVETPTGERSPFESDETHPGEHPHGRHRPQDRE